MNWRDEYKKKLTSVEKAAEKIESGDRIFIGSAGCLPLALVNAVCLRPELRDVTMVSSTNGTDCLCMTDPDTFGRVRYNTVFLGSADRRNMALGNVNPNSVPFHRVADAVRRAYGVNVLMLEATPPDEEGYLYYGARSASWALIDEYAEKKIFQINACQQPFGGRHNRIHISETDALCRCDGPLPTYAFRAPDRTDEKIAAHIISRVRDGDTLQIGIGGIPNSIAYGLAGKKHLGIHSEVLTESAMYLMSAGAVDLDRVEASFALPSCGRVDEKLAPHIRLAPMEYINDPFEVGKIPNFVSINSCMMTDLLGQVCSEGYGEGQYSGVGGQLDFVRGAALSAGGRSFLCLHSRHRDKNGRYVSNILAQLPAGAIVTTPRTDVMYIVTEWGAADLFDKPAEERAYELINIAHPDFRRELFEQAADCGIIRRNAADFGRIRAD